jgi:NAD(P)-dependent dehydrogenase (short-subunit alcohol dehydrogenase family)
MTQRKAALVTGAATGIGAATVRAFAGRGVDVAINHLGEGDIAAAEVPRPSAGGRVFAPISFKPMSAIPNNAAPSLIERWPHWAGSTISSTMPAIPKDGR